MPLKVPRENHKLSSIRSGIYILLAGMSLWHVPICIPFCSLPDRPVRRGTPGFQYPKHRQTSRRENAQRSDDDNALSSTSTCMKKLTFRRIIFCRLCVLIFLNILLPHTMQSEIAGAGGCDFFQRCPSLNLWIHPLPIPWTRISSPQQQMLRACRPRTAVLS
ncbi:hypothetical protein BDR05DRAFT_956774 [Suillus weaverae]|nr:hypothetical protein BDR05DRAFT_956774 [Suillus weaverae]